MTTAVAGEGLEGLVKKITDLQQDIADLKAQTRSGTNALGGQAGGSGAGVAGYNNLVATVTGKCAVSVGSSAGSHAVKWLSCVTDYEIGITPDLVVLGRRTWYQIHARFAPIVSGDVSDFHAAPQPTIDESKSDFRGSAKVAAGTGSLLDGVNFWVIHGAGSNFALKVSSAYEASGDGRHAPSGLSVTLEIRRMDA